MSQKAKNKNKTSTSTMISNLVQYKTSKQAMLKEELGSSITVKEDQTKTKHRRLKIWEINASYHCSIIGTCLTLGELRTMVKKSGFQVDNNVFDYEIHGIGVHHSCKKCPLSKRIEKKLKEKYRAFERRYAVAENEKELFYLWQEDLDQGHVAGAYWAVMGHPRLTEKVRQHVFGEVHMLSHIVGSQQRADLSRLQHLEQRCKDLKCKTSKHQDSQKELKHENSLLQKRLEENDKTVQSIDRRLARAMKTIDKLEKRSEIKRLQKELARFEQKYLNSSESLRKLEKSLRDNEKENRTLVRANQDLRATLKEREIELIERTEECIHAEEQLISELSRHMERECKDHLSPNCPGPELCGKRILYVGGQTNLIRHYKALIELSGGEFIHHDGGVEDAKQRLASLMAQADVLFCPVDCISHDACLRVKRTCKQMGKPFVPLRSSGVSSLARGLTAIAEL